jgi:hypothetical protein
MRNNPKLLMQMIPDVVKSEDAQRDNKTKQDMVLKRSRVHDKIEEAQQWQKLQKLANNFMTKR